jgi:hypothetical protein
MTIRFAGAQAEATSVIAAWRCRSVALCAANDNVRETLDQGITGAALRHFVRHGLAAAERAAAEADTALRAGDRSAGLTWLAVCRQFDRRMADSLAAQLGG